MKNINKFIYIVLAGLLVAACGDPELRFQSYDNSEKGAFARLLNLSGVFIDVDPAGSNYNATVEFYDEAQGRNIASYSWTVEYRANGGGNGGVDLAEVDLITIPASSFTTNARGLPEVTFALNMQASLTALGLTTTDVAGGDQFRFHAMVNKTDGTSYGDGNTGNNVISQSPFQALVRVTANIVCGSSGIAGAVTFSTTAMKGGGAGIGKGGNCPGTVTGADTITEAGSGLSIGTGLYSIADLGWGQYGHCWSDAPATDGNAFLTDVCGKLNYGSGGHNLDQYGLTYGLENVTVANDVLTFDWFNNYADFGTTTLTRVDGLDWPALTGN